MVAYFKLQNNLLMLTGAALGIAAGIVIGSGLTYSMANYMYIFVLALFAFAGIVAGRIISFFCANWRLKRLYAILYQKGDGEEFFKRFLPFVNRVPVHTIEYIDGMHHLAYACETLGNYDKALQLLGSLEPEKLHLHSLAGTAVVCNQKMRLYLLSGRSQEARQQLTHLQEIEKAAKVRAPMISANLRECIRLGKIWLSVIENGQPINCDDYKYLKDEARLAKDSAYRREIEGLLRQISDRTNISGQVNFAP